MKKCVTFPELSAFEAHYLLSKEKIPCSDGGAVVGTVVGAAAGAAFDGDHGAAVGAGSGLLIGAAAGSNAGLMSASAVQQRYNSSYVQCMYTKGNRVPVSGRLIGTPPSGSYPPPPPDFYPLPPPS